MFWNLILGKGAFQTSCFNWELMEQVGHRPKETEERQKELARRMRMRRLLYRFRGIKFE